MVPSVVVASLVSLLCVVGAVGAEFDGAGVDGVHAGWVQNQRPQQHLLQQGHGRRKLEMFGGPRSYKEGDPVPLFVNKIGPFHNPSETYQYYDLPVCHPSDGAVDKLLSLGEVLAADRMVSTNQ